MKLSFMQFSRMLERVKEGSYEPSADVLADMAQVEAPAGAVVDRGEEESDIEEARRRA